jgi:hypothetical protein
MPRMAIIMNRTARWSYRCTVPKLRNTRPRARNASRLGEHQQDYPVAAWRRTLPSEVGTDRIALFFEIPDGTIRVAIPRESARQLAASITAT